MADRAQVGGMAVGGAEALAPLLARFGDADEAQRYRLLSSLLAECADRSAAGSNGRSAETAEQVESLNKRIVRLGEEQALLNDALATTRADLAQKGKLLEAEQARSAELQRVADDQRARLAMIQLERGGLEQQVTERNAALHRAEVETDQLRLKLQRAELSAGDTSRVESLESEKLKLAAQAQEIATAMERLRQDKDAEIEALKGELGGARTQTSTGADALLTALWQRLATAQPPLAPGTAVPNDKAAERLFDALIELTRFAHEFDQSMRIFLARYTKHNPAIKTPWEAYAKFDDVLKTVQQTIAVAGGRPVGVLKMRLSALKKWTVAAMIGCDSVLESAGSQLEQQLRGPLGLGSDPNALIRNYLKQDGHQLFADAVREMRSEKIAEAYGHGM